MAQQVEHFLGKEEVTGSNPVSSSIKNHRIWWFFFILVLFLLYFVARVIMAFVAHKVSLCATIIFYRKKQVLFHIKNRKKNNRSEMLKNGLILSSWHTFWHTKFCGTRGKSCNDF